MQVSLSGCTPLRIRGLSATHAAMRGPRRALLFAFALALASTVQVALEYASFEHASFEHVRIHVAPASTAHAQVPEHPDGRVHDWLVWWPRCAQDAFVPERIATSQLLYPRPGLPAVVRAGQRLSTRVRLAAPLTPPPGVQQEKALRGWSASLEGQSTWRVPQAEHRHLLRVSDVRPDTRVSTVFRASIDLPPWLPPGTYDLVLRVPGGEVLGGVASVRVIDREAPVLARLPDDLTDDLIDDAASEVLRDTDVDVWVGDASDALRRPLRGAGLPWLDPAVGAVLAIGDDGVWDRPRCDDPLVPREAALRALGSRRSVSPMQSASRVRVARVERADGTEGAIHRAQIEGVARLSFVVPEGWVVRATGAEVLGAWPATPVRAAGTTPSVVVWLAANAARGTVTVEAAPAPPLEARLEAPRTFSSGRAGNVMAHAQEGAFVALAWEEDGAAWGRVGEELPVALRWMEASEIHGLVLAPDGRSARVAATVEGVARRPGGCASGGSASGGGAGGMSGIGWLAAWLCTIGVARYTSARSRPRTRSLPPPRSGVGSREQDRSARSFSARP